jgi:hypothetical protein
LPITWEYTIRYWYHSNQDPDFLELSNWHLAHVHHSNKFAFQRRSKYIMDYISSVAPHSQYSLLRYPQSFAFSPFIFPNTSILSIFLTRSNFCAVS